MNSRLKKKDFRSEVTHQANRSDFYTSYRPKFRSQYPTSIQDTFLEYCVRRGLDIKVHLKNDSIKQGRLHGFDNWTLILGDTEQDMLLLFKSGIQAIVPCENISWYEMQDQYYMERAAEPNFPYPATYKN